MIQVDFFSSTADAFFQIVASGDQALTVFFRQFRSGVHNPRTRRMYPLYPAAALSIATPQDSLRRRLFVVHVGGRDLEADFVHHGQRSGGYISAHRGELVGELLPWHRIQVANRRCHYSQDRLDWRIQPKTLKKGRPVAREPR